MRFLLLLSLLYALPRKSQAVRGKFTELTVLPVAFAHGQTLLCPTSPSSLRDATSPIEGRPWHTGKFRFYTETRPLRQRLPY